MTTPADPRVGQRWRLVTALPWWRVLPIGAVVRVVRIDPEVVFFEADPGIWTNISQEEFERSFEVMEDQ